MKRIFAITAIECIGFVKNEYADNLDVFEKYAKTLRGFVSVDDRIDLSDEGIVNASKEFVNEMCDRLWYAEIPTYEIVYKMHKICSAMTNLYKYAGVPVEFSYTLEKPITVF